MPVERAEVAQDLDDPINGMHHDLFGQVGGVPVPVTALHHHLGDHLAQRLSERRRLGGHRGERRLADDARVGVTWIGHLRLEHPFQRHEPRLRGRLRRCLHSYGAAARDRDESGGQCGHPRTMDCGDVAGPPDLGRARHTQSLGGLRDQCGFERTTRGDRPSGPHPDGKRAGGGERVAMTDIKRELRRHTRQLIRPSPVHDGRIRPGGDVNRDESTSRRRHLRPRRRAPRCRATRRNRARVVSGRSVGAAPHSGAAAAPDF